MLNHKKYLCGSKPWTPLRKGATVDQCLTVLVDYTINNPHPYERAWSLKQPDLLADYRPDCLAAPRSSVIDIRLPFVGHTDLDQSINADDDHDWQTPD